MFYNAGIEPATYSLSANCPTTGLIVTLLFYSKLDKYF